MALQVPGFDHVLPCAKRKQKGNRPLLGPTWPLAFAAREAFLSAAGRVPTTLREVGPNLGAPRRSADPTSDAWAHFGFSVDGFSVQNFTALSDSKGAEHVKHIGCSRTRSWNHDCDPT